MRAIPSIWHHKGRAEGPKVLESSRGAEGAKKCKKYKCEFGEFDEQKWLAVGGDAKYRTDFMRAKPDQQKETSFGFLERHIKDVMVADARAMPSQGPLV